MMESFKCNTMLWKASVIVVVVVVDVVVTAVVIVATSIVLSQCLTGLNTKMLGQQVLLFYGMVFDNI